MGVSYAEYAGCSEHSASLGVWKHLSLSPIYSNQRCASMLGIGRVLEFDFVDLLSGSAKLLAKLHDDLTRRKDWRYDSFAQASLVGNIFLEVWAHP
ncbi:hypothetical protein BS78_01G032700 [Paspalum vaginatum]|nr:hypothetical protein BS78_01G032700 [Paspalum vaginatum]